MPKKSPRGFPISSVVIALLRNSSKNMFWPDAADLLNTTIDHLDDMPNTLQDDSLGINTIIGMRDKDVRHEGGPGLYPMHPSWIDSTLHNLASKKRTMNTACKHFLATAQQPASATNNNTQPGC